MRRHRYVICDVFTDRPLAGNPLAVFTDARGLDVATMQALARETNLSETTFVWPAEGPDAEARVRIFTPVCELPFAGHPILGTAFVLGGPLQREVLRLQTGRGVIPVRLEREGARVVFGWMDQPLPTWRLCAGPESVALCAALGVDRSALPVEVYDNGVEHAFVVLPSRDAVAAVRPDLARLAALPILGVSTVAGEDLRWKTRMFAPRVGVAEDPATGSAAGPLAFHLARHACIPFGEEIVIEQGTEVGRPSRLHARVWGTALGATRVEVGGAAVIVARGEFSV